MDLGAETPLRVIPAPATAQSQPAPVVVPPRQPSAPIGAKRPALRRLAPGAAAVVLAAGGLTQLSGVTAAAAAEAHATTGGAGAQDETSPWPSGIAVVPIQWVTSTTAPATATSPTTDAAAGAAATTTSTTVPGATSSSGAPSSVTGSISTPTSDTSAGTGTSPAGSDPAAPALATGATNANASAQPAVAVSPNASPSVSIAVTNNAAGTGYGSSETASAASKNVPYRVVVTNPNSASGKITLLTDTVNGNTMNICPDLIGASLAPGVAATCDFTGPVPTQATTLKSAVTLSVGAALATGSGTTTVFPPTSAATATTAPPTTQPTSTTTAAPVVVVPANPAASAVGAASVGNPSLARTGAPVKTLVIWMALLLLTGMCILAGLELSDPRRRLIPLLASTGPTSAGPSRSARSAGPPRAPRSPAARWQSGHRWETGWWSPAALGSPARRSDFGWPPPEPPPAPPPPPTE